MYWRVVRLSASRRICPDVAAWISGSWSRWCSTTCRLTVTEKWRAGPSLASCQNYHELSSASCLDPAWFGTRYWKPTISSKLVPPLPEDHLVVVCQQRQITSSVWMLDHHFRTMRKDLDVRHRRGFVFHRRSPLPRTRRSDTWLMLALKDGFVRGQYRSWYAESDREKKKSRRWQPYAVSSQARPTL